MKISLVVLSAGKAAGKALPINGAQFIIGRDPECNLRPASAMISKRHCGLLVKNNQVSLRDFDSTNGTFLNDQPVKGEVSAKDGDILRVGPLSFRLEIEAVAAPVKQEPAAAPVPVSVPAHADISDDDAAAALLSIDDETGSVNISDSETSEAAVPGGSTVMDMPAFAATGQDPQQPAADAKKPEEKKPAAKKPSQGAAQDAAKAIFDKLRAGKRK
jgi:hypothetical protein